MAERRLLPELNLNMFQGVKSKYNPETTKPVELRISRNTVYFPVYGAIKKFPGTKRVLSSQYTENNIPGKIPWIDFFKNPALIAEDSRQVIFQSGTSLSKLETDGSYTQLDTGYRDDIYRTSCRFDNYLYMTGQGFDNIGRRDKMVKYNGYTIENWGVNAPGTTETVVEPFKSTTNFDLNNMTLTPELEMTWDGYALKATSSSVVSSYSFHKVLDSPLYVPTNTINRLGIYVKINPGDLIKLANAGNSLVFHFSADNTSTALTDTGNFKFTYSIGELNEGWNQLLFDFYQATSPFDPSSLAIRSFQVTIVPNTPGQSPVLYFSRLFVRDSGAPDLVPGATLSVLNSFDSLTGWSAINGATTFSLNTTIFKEGLASIQLNKTSNASNIIGIENSSVSMNMSNAADDLIHFQVFVPTPANINAVKIRVGSNSSNYFEYTSSFTFTTGWNNVQFTRSAPTAQAGAGAVFTSPITYLLAEIIFVQTETIESGYLIDNLFQAVTTSGGVLNGTYSYRITFETTKGLISNAGSISVPVTLAVGGGSIVLNNIPVSSDPQVIRRRIYRTAGDGSEYLYVTTIQDNTTTTFTDDIPDGSLLPLPPPDAGRDDFDNSPPPFANLSQVWRRTLFLAGDPLNPNILYFSAPDDPESFPLINAFELDARIMSVFANYLGFIVITEDSIYRLIGENPNFILERISDGIGCIGPRACNSGKLQGWFIDHDGVRLFDFSEINKISENIRDVFDGLDPTFLTQTFGIHSRRNNCILQFYPDNTGRYTKIWNYEYMSDDMGSGWWSEIVPPPSLNIVSGVEIELNNGEVKLYVGSDDGMIFELFNYDNENWELSDGTTAPIRLEIQTPYIRDDLSSQGLDRTLYGAERGLYGNSRIKPRFFEIRTSEKNGKKTQWSATVDVANGTSDDSAIYGTSKLDMPVIYQSTTRRDSIPANNAGYTFRFNLVNEDPDVNITLLGTSLKYEMLPGQTAFEE